ncbi:MAG: hypothetical protein Q4A45_01700 [Clostridia bacterium]|nr:hypothetical protein [Clostridia bacterium]
MKSVLISIRPKWCELIASGKKTIEVRKTKPKIETPFKCYIYCTTSELLTRSHYNDKIYVATSKKYQKPLERNGNITLSSKVIGEFVCDAIIGHCEMANADIAEQQGCIKREQLFEYANGKELFGWHISDLVIYDKPKELREFLKPCIDPQRYCEVCTHRHVIFYSNIYDEDYEIECLNRVMKPPQSWCYIEEGQ